MSFSKWFSRIFKAGRKDASLAAFKQVENQHKWFLEAINLLPKPFFLMDFAAQKVAFSNIAAKKFLGFEYAEHKPDEVYGTQFDVWDINGKKLQTHELPTARVLRGETIEGEELLIRTRAGLFNVKIFTAQLPAAFGQPASGIIVFQDVTEIRKTEKLLRQNQSWLEAALRGIGDGVVATDASSPPQITFLNPVAEKLTGWSLGDARGKPVAEVFNIINQATRKPAFDPIARVLREGVTVGVANHTILVSKDGSEYVIEDSAAPILTKEGGVDGVVLIFRDTTKEFLLRQEKEEANRQTKLEQEKLNLVFAQAPLPLALLEGPKHHIRFANPSYEKYFLQEKNYANKSIAEVLPEASDHDFIKLLDEVYQTGKAFKGSETLFEYIDADGRKIELFLNFVYEPVRDITGKIEGVLAVISDVTEQIVARQKEIAVANELEIVASDLLNAKNKLVAIFESSTLGLALVQGPDFRFEMVNETYKGLVSARDYVGKRWIDVYSELAGSKFPEIMKDVLSTGKTFTVSEVLVSVEAAPGVLENRFYNVDYVRILDSSNQPYGILIQATNITDHLKSKHEIQASQSDVVDTIESMSDAFFSFDKDWKITRVNENMTPITGLKREEMLGKDPRDLWLTVAEYKQSQYWTQFHKVMSERVPVSFLEYYKPLDVWTQVRAFPKSDGGVAVFFSDVTDTKYAEEQLHVSETNFKAITEATPLIVWTSKPDGAVDYANSRWYEFSGLTKEQTMGSGFTSIIHPEDVQDTMDKYLAALTSGKPLEIEHRFKRGSDQQYRWFLTRAVPAFDEQGKPVKWFGTNVDIDDQKQTAAELIIAKAEAERSNHTKSAFLANMSHEIRTPLGAIVGFADLLRDRELPQQERTQYLDTISRNGKALTRIIDDILDLAKVESGKLETEKIEFSFLEIIDDVMDVFRERTLAKKIHLRTSFEEGVASRIVSDPTRLRQILLNIVGNAVKFTDNGGVNLLIKSKKVAEGRIQIEVHVKDTGVGMNQEQQDRLFQPFMQADNSTTRKFGGTGLGLALSKRLANALGGDIQITDCQFGKGCTFVVTFLAGLPDEKNSRAFSSGGAARVAPSQEFPSLEGVKILVADDSPDNLVLVELMLSRQGATIVTADNGREAFKIGMSDSFDIVLMDIQMPGMDGYEATKALREAGFKKPVIALTAHAMAEERARSKAAGCNAHLTKPLNQLELITTIAKFTRG